MNHTFESSHWVGFNGQIETMTWGEKVYTVLQIPEDVIQKISHVSSNRVDVEIREFSYNLALTKAPVFDGIFLYFGKEKLNETHLSIGESADF